MNEVAVTYADSCGKEYVGKQEIGLNNRNGQDFGEFIKKLARFRLISHCTPEVRLYRVNMLYINNELFL